MDILHPADWPRPKGYSNAVIAEGRFIFLAGIIGWTVQEELPDHTLTGQLRQALQNIKTILAEADCTPYHIVRMTWYVKDMDCYRQQREKIGRIYRAEFGKVFPAMTCVAVTELVEPDAQIEIEVTAAYPNA